jgi:hypothetical protein
VLSYRVHALLTAVIHDVEVIAAQLAEVFLDLAA